MKAAVYKQYGDAAIMNIVLEALPKVNPHILSRNQVNFVLNKSFFFFVYV
jgi:hypothetical protein